MKRRVHIVEIIHGSAVTIQALHSIIVFCRCPESVVYRKVEIIYGSAVITLSLFVTGVLKHSVQIVEIIYGSAVTIQALHSIIVCYRYPEA